MHRSWLRAGLSAAGFAAVFLLLRAVLAEGSPHPHDLALAGGVYTLAFAARMSV
jgi:hypothetical protein